MSCLKQDPLALTFLRVPILRPELFCSITLSVCRSSKWQGETKNCLCLQYLTEWTCRSSSACECVSDCSPLCYLTIYTKHISPVKAVDQNQSVSRWRHKTAVKNNRHTHTHPHIEDEILSCWGIPFLKYAVFIFSDNFLGQVFVSVFIWSPGSKTSSQSPPFYRLQPWRSMKNRKCGRLDTKNLLFLLCFSSS